MIGIVLCKSTDVDLASQRRLFFFLVVLGLVLLGHHIQLLCLRRRHEGAQSVRSFEADANLFESETGVCQSQFSILTQPTHSPFGLWEVKVNDKEDGNEAADEHTVVPPSDVV